MTLPTDAPSAPPYTALSQALDAVLDRAVGEQRVVGAVVLVAHRGTVVYRRAAGHAHREANAAMREDTLFRLASITKPIVSAAALTLVADGTLAVDDTVERWLPGFRPRLADGRVPPITLHHLLTHTAGLDYGFLQPPGGPYAAARVSDGLDHEPGLTLEENLRRIAGVPLRFEPGSAWRYSVATDVLGAVLQAASGQALPALVRRRVLAPLGLRDCGFVPADGSRLAVPYSDATRPPRRIGALEVVELISGDLRLAPGRALDPAAFPSGGGGMVGTAPEVLAFLEAMRRGGAPVLPAELARLLREHRIGALRVDQMAPGWGFGYGGAVLIDPATARTPQSPGTWSWGGAWGHQWFVDPVRELSVVALTNTMVEGMVGRFPGEVRDAVYAALGP